MIHSDNGIVSIEGTTNRLLADLGIIMRVMIEKGITDITTLHSLVETANLTDKEVHEHLEALMKNMAATTVLDMIFADMDRSNSELSKERTKHAEDMLNIIKEVKRRKK